MMLIKSTLFISLLFLSGCVLGTIFGRPSDLTPEQIKAYAESGHDVYKCFQVGGPPPAGGLTVLVLPKTFIPDIAFSSNCQLLQAKSKEDPPFISQ